MSKPWASLDALYICDNGRVLCGKHLGSMARATGRDISGQRVEEVTAADCEAPGVPVVSCETCGQGPRGGRVITLTGGR